MAAFKRQFGVPPARYRREQRAALNKLPKRRLPTQVVCVASGRADGNIYGNQPQNIQRCSRHQVQFEAVSVLLFVSRAHPRHEKTHWPQQMT